MAQSKPGIQEKHPNIFIWVLFSCSFLLFIIGAIVYGVGTKDMKLKEDPLFNSWPLLDAFFRLLPHVIVCLIYRLFRFASNKSVVLAFHVILAVLAFIGTVFANEHQVHKGDVFNTSVFTNVVETHRFIPKDPIIWIFSSWLEFLYIFIAICIFFLCRANSQWVRSVQEGCHALFGIFFLLTFTIDFVMSLNARDAYNKVVKGDFADVSMTFFAMTSVIFAMVSMYIVVNPYFDWKHYGAGDSVYITGTNPKSIHRSEEGSSGQQHNRQTPNEPKRKQVSSY